MKFIICLVPLCLIIKEIQSVEPPLSSKFVFQPSLEHRSLIQVGINLWKNKNIMDKMKIDINRLFYAGSGVPSVVVKRLLRDIDYCIKNLTLPSQLKKGIPQVDFAIGEKTIEYLLDVRRSLGRDDEHPTFNDYIENIEYSDLGLVNKSRTIRAIYNNIRKKYPRDTYNYKFLFIEACKYCSEIDINLIWQELSDEEKYEIGDAATDTLNLHHMPGFNPYTKAIVLYWGIHLNLFQSNEPSHTSETILQNLFKTFSQRMFLYEDIETFKYFFHKMNYKNETEKDLFLLDDLIAIETRLRFPDNIDNWIFVMQQLSDSARLRYLNKIEIMRIINLIKHWPWRYLYIDILDSLLKIYGDTTQEDYAKILAIITDTIIDGHDISKDFKYFDCWIISTYWSHYKRQFNGSIVKAYWESTYWNSDTPTKLKALIVLKKCFRLETIDHVPKTRAEIFEVAFNYRWHIDMKDEWDMLYQIYKNILETEEERYNYVSSINMNTISNYFISNGERYDIVDELLNTKCRNDEKMRKYIKHSTQWPEILRKVMKNADDMNERDKKSNKFFNWLELSNELKTELFKCIKVEKRSIYNDKDWKKMEKCLKKTVRPSDEKFQWAEVFSVMKADSLLPQL